MSLKRKVAGSVLVIAAVAVVVGAVTFSAFTATTENPDNQFKAGTVVLGDNDSDAALFDLTQMQPGVPVEKCLTVTYTGTLDANVHLYAATEASAVGKELAPYLNVKVTKGTGPAPVDCTGFTAGSVLDERKLDTWPTNYAGAPGNLAIEDPATWQENDSAVYRIRVEVDDDDAAQGKDAQTLFTFEAQDVPAP